ncbi:hypothetical protein COO60DRAFT_494155 [Scenedesmus sp. NREL 46B-D3]|nr:hypothetical protein COO60DRAFT_494155 [Scenedesmus sp. NREL 46B-D3]
MRGAELHAKLTLVQQLKQLSKQHEQVLQAYERKVEEKLAEVARQGAGGATKRMGAPLHAEGPEAKRQRQLIDRDNRRKIIWDEIIKLVEKIRKNPKSEAFRSPVDPVKLKIPDYPNIIHFPMDIGTVLKKLRSTPRGYSQPLEVAQDVRQIWINCRTYNGEKHPVTAHANILSENFERAWGQANIAHKWQVEVKREEREEQTFAERGPEDGAGDDDLVTQLRSRRNMLGDLIAAKDLQESLPPGALGELAPDRDMTFEEKRKLSAHIASVPGERLSAVLDIVEECEDLPSDDGAERELDMDNLNNASLWKLKAYVDGVLTATTGPPPKKTAANRSSAGGAPTKHAPAAAAPAPAPAAMPVPTVPPAAAGVPPPAAVMAPPPPGPVGVKPEPATAAAAAPAEQQPGSAAAGAPAAAAPSQQQQPPPQLPPPQLQQQAQQQQQQQQQQQDSPQDSGGASADEVVASTAGGAGTRAVTMHTLGDACTVAQSGTNVRPSHFVKSKPRAPLPPGAAGADGQKNAGEPTGMDVDVNDDWAALTKGEDAPADAPAADAAAQVAAADAKQEPGSSGGAAAAGVPAGSGAGAAVAGVKQEPAAAGDGGGGGAAAAGGGADMWDEFAEKAKQEEEKLQKQREEEEQRKRAEEEQQRQLAELERQKELELQQQLEAKKQQTAQELAAAAAPSGAVAENATVLQEMNTLMDAAEVDNVMMEVDEDEDDDDGDAGGDADAGAGFD